MRARLVALGSIARAWPAAALLALALAAAACGGDDDSSTAEDTGTTTEAAQGTTPTADAAGCSAEVDHPLVPLSSVRLWVFRGSEKDPETGETIQSSGEMRVLDESAEVGGFQVAVVEVKESEDGELVERTLDYYSQCEDGSVWYVGEKVDDYEDGEIVGHDGQWQAGKDGAEPGLFMPADPKVGDRFEQERAPGVAEDRSTVVSAGVGVKTPAGSFDDCIKTKDFAPLDNSTEFKFYCSGVGLVREQRPGLLNNLVRYR
jgi:hypothetical protein